MRDEGRPSSSGWVQVFSITSDNEQFHPSGFQPVSLAPEEETSFQVRSARETQET